MSEPAAFVAPPPGADPEKHWVEHVYRPNEAQLTVRAALTGMLLGAVMCLSNLYVVLKTGWSLGVTVTACVLAWGTFAGLGKLGLVRREFGVLENNAMGSVASAAGYMTGGGNMAALPALLLLTGTRPDAGWLVAWFAVIAALGVFAAIPIKRQLINIEQVPFPTGIATAETLRALHGHGSGARRQARLLGASAAAGAAIAWLREANVAWMPFRLPATFGLPFSIGGVEAAKWTLAFEGSLLMTSAGALTSLRTGWSMLLGALLTYGVLAPAMVANGVIASVSYKAIVQWTLWGGAAVLVSSGVLSFAFQWRMVAKSFREVALLLRPGARTNDDPLADVEAPPSWFPLGFLVLGPIVVFLGWKMFAIPLWAGLLALPLAVVMGVIAARVTGETDVTPTKALGPLTQLIYGGIAPGNLGANVMGANITGGVGLHAADLLTDLKSGYLLGARPRQQLYAQLFGVVAGAAVVVPAFNLLVPTADVLGSEALPAPAAQVWAGVSRMLVAGTDALHPTARLAVLIGLVVGAVLALLERFLPARLKPFVPAPTGLGIAMVIPAYNAISFFLGALAAHLASRRESTRGAVLPVASGIIAGESLAGIVVKVLVALGALPK